MKGSYLSTMLFIGSCLVFSFNLSAEKTLKPVVFYLQYLPQERIGTETDEVIIDSLQRQNFWVIPVDCSEFPTVSPALEEQLITFHKASPTLLESYATDTEEADLDKIYYVPEGYILKPNIPIWNILDHGVDGLINRIMDTWNKEIVDAFGVDSVTTPEEMYDKHGNPIDYNMYMDLIYPSGTLEKHVPLILNFSSNSPRQKPYNPTRVEQNIFPFGFLTTGYAWAVVDHCYNPLARPDVWKYFDRYTLEDWAGLALVTAYVRYVNLHLDDYNLNGKIGTMGISKASYSSVRIANTKNAEGREHFLYGGVENTKPQPWLGVPSMVDVAYAAAGNGTRRVNQYVDEHTVPMITSAGSKDQYNQWDVYPEVVKRFNDLDKEHLAMWMEDQGHTYPSFGIDLATGESRHVLFKKFFDHYLKRLPTDPLEVFYVYPKEDAQEVDTKGLTRILTHDGILPVAMLGLSPYAPITVRFLSEIDPVAFEQQVKIYPKNSDVEIAGSWTAKTGNTTFEFTPESDLVKDETYKIVVGANLENVQGQKMNTEFVREFTVTQDGEEEVETKSTFIYPSDDTYQKVSQGTTDYGSQSTMRIRYSTYGEWRFDGYIKFNIVGLDAEKIKSATLKLSSSTVLTGDPITLTIYKTTNDWTESTLLSANKPSVVGTGLDIVSFTGTELWTCFDVTNQLKSDINDSQTEISFMIRAATGGNTENVYFNTKEAVDENLGPALVLEEVLPPTGLDVNPSDEMYFRFADKKLFLTKDEKVHTMVFDLFGKMLISKILSNNNHLDFSGLPAGVYMASLQTDTQSKVLKIILNN